MTEKRTATETLLASSTGDPRSFDALFALVMDELHGVAVGHMSRERGGHSLQPTALVNEVYLRLIRAEDVEWRDRNHFYAVASRCIRRLLTEHARRRDARKRGDGIARVSLHEPDLPKSEARDVALLDLDLALTDLEEKDPRQAQVVELRFFAGLSVEETAQQLGCSAGTIKNDWRFARAWLQARLSE
ncbi:MAG: RNA polymerase sigma factor (TIGR02999 family) [Gammaproteobacteria bacterium]|jgi:RNA polymerase sigma factor (TIGR02999 family)